MSSRASTGPKEGTGALNQLGSRWRHPLRNATRRGQRGQSRGAFPCGECIEVSETCVVGVTVPNISFVNPTRRVLQQPRAELSNVAREGARIIALSYGSPRSSG